MKRLLFLQHSRAGNVLIVVLIALVAMVVLAAALNVLGWIIAGLVGVLTVSLGLVFGFLKWAIVFTVAFLAFVFKVGVVVLLLGLLVVFVLKALVGMGRGRRRDRDGDERYAGRYSDRWERRHGRHERD